MSTVDEIGGKHSDVAAIVAAAREAQFGITIAHESVCDAVLWLNTSDGEEFGSVYYVPGFTGQLESSHVPALVCGRLAGEEDMIDPPTMVRCIDLFRSLDSIG